MGLLLSYIPHDRNKEKGGYWIGTKSIRSKHQQSSALSACIRRNDRTVSVVQFAGMPRKRLRREMLSSRAIIEKERKRKRK